MAPATFSHPCGYSPRPPLADVWAISKGSRAKPKRERNYFGTAWREQQLRTCGPSAKVLARSPNANETIYAQRGASNEQHVRACGPSAKVLARNPNANEKILVQHGRCNICCHGGHRQGHSATQTRTSRVWRSVARAALAAILAVGKVTPRPRREQPGVHEMAKATLAAMSAIGEASRR